MSVGGGLNQRQLKDTGSVLSINAMFNVIIWGEGYV